MPNVMANGIRIEYETFGDPGGKPLLLVMGLGAQMIRWPEDFCMKLAGQGHYVVRYDNRDVGLSQHFDDKGVPDMAELFRKSKAGEDIAAPYTMDDMASDGIGLLDALRIEASHICGASLGGMIVQTMAVNQPARVRSLTSIMSSAGVPVSKPEALTAMAAPAPTTREESIEAALVAGRTNSGDGYEFDEPTRRAVVAAEYDRAFHPQGAARQMVAIVTDGSRVAGLQKLDVPSLVIHGTDDSLIAVEGGMETAAAIPNAELILIEGMGHELPRGAWPQIIDPICALTDRAN